MHWWLVYAALQPSSILFPPASMLFPGVFSPDLPRSAGGSGASHPLPLRFLRFCRRGCWRGWVCDAASFPPPFASPQLLWHDSESATAEASEDALRGKRSVEERPLFLFFAPLPPSHGGRALTDSTEIEYPHLGRLRIKKYISVGKFIFSSFYIQKYYNLTHLSPI